MAWTFIFSTVLGFMLQLQVQQLMKMIFITTGMQVRKTLNRAMMSIQLSLPTTPCTECQTNCGSLTVMNSPTGLATITSPSIIS